VPRLCLSGLVPTFGIERASRRMPTHIRSYFRPAALLTLAALALFGTLSPAAASAAPKVRSLGGGAWCWFADPRGVHHEGTYNRTYVGWLDRQGDVKLASYDHNTRLRTTVVLHWALGVDDHNNPSLHVLPDGRLMVFYSEHNGDAMYYRISTRPEDITSWGRERTACRPTRSRPRRVRIGATPTLIQFN
jgi:hypothetical protein